MIWKSIGTHELSNTGEIRNRFGRILKKTQKRNTEIVHFKGGGKSVRKLLIENFDKKDISYDIGIPPRKALIRRIKTGKIGVYPHSCPTSKKKWRYLIQKDNKQYAGYFHTKTQARINWIMKYSELYDLKLTSRQILEMI